MPTPNEWPADWRAEQDRDIHRARLANLEDDPPELGESAEAYLARMIHEHGATYRDAAAERYRGHAQREAHAVTDAARELMRFRKPAA